MTATSGEECLNLMEEIKPELIILDYHMPNQDGLQTIKELEKLELDFDYKLILLSSDISTLRSAVLKSDNINDCLFKPIKQSQLLDCLLNVMVVGVDREEPKDTSDNLTIKNGFEFKILLAEDNMINQKVALMLFEKLGLQIDIAENGRIALEMAQNTDYDLIFMDYHMPEMDGIHSTALIKKKKIKTPIVAMTANAMKGDREHFIASGMDDYMSKPVKIEDLNQVVKRWLKNVS